MLPRPHRILIAVLCLVSGAVTLATNAQAAPATAGFVTTLAVQGLGKGTVTLEGPWEFHTGDEMAWAEPGFDDSLWDRLSASRSWGQQGYESYEGYAWYRLHVSLAPAPGAPVDFSLLIPAIDDVYEIYWNGQRVGGMGTMPPHWTSYAGVRAQIYDLGPARDGVLAVRVWKTPLFSTDDGRGGGFEGAPLVGSAEAVADARANLDLGWLRRRQFQFALTSLYALVMLFSLVGWLRDRKEWLLFWMAMLSAMLVADLFLNGMRLQVSSALLICLTQIEIALREMSLWFLLLWLLQLQKNRKLRVLVRKAALIATAASVLDGLTSFVYPSPLNARQAQLLDAALTPAIIFFELLPLILAVYALLSRQRLDSARWVVAAVAFANGITYFLQNVTSQGIRFTHWDFSTRMTSPLFNLADNPINLLVLLRSALFFSIVYAVIRTFMDDRKRAGAMEQEYKNARELQRVLVPTTLPVVPGFTLTSAYQPAHEVGGDFFQIIPLEKSATLVVLGDVSGKGLTAAMAVSLIVGALRALAEDYPRPAELLTLLNRRLSGRLQGGFATCVIVRLEVGGACTMASAGHPAPFLNSREIELPGALPLGIAPTVEYTESTVRVQAGDSFALYTDGLLEARDQTGELYSFGRLAALFATRPSAAQATQAAISFGQDDDITVLTLTRLAMDEAPVAAQATKIPA